MTPYAQRRWEAAIRAGERPMWPGRLEVLGDGQPSSLLISAPVPRSAQADRGTVHFQSTVHVLRSDLSSRCRVDTLARRSERLGAHELSSNGCASALGAHPWLILKPVTRLAIWAPVHESMRRIFEHEQSSYV